MSGLDELIIGAFFNERPPSALPWMTSEVEGRHTKATSDVAGKDLTDCKTPDTEGEAASPWSDLRSDSCHNKDAEDRTFGKTRASDKGIISKEFSDEVMTKVALGELSVSNITSGYGHKAKAQQSREQSRVQNENKTIIDVGFEEMLSRNTKAIGSKPNGSISGIYDTTKPSYLDKIKAKSHFIEDKGCNGKTGPLNRFSNEGNPNKIVDVGFEEFIPRMTKSFLGDSLSANVELDTKSWLQHASGTSCLSLQSGTSSTDTEIQKTFTDISSGNKPKVFPWDEKKLESVSTRMECDTLFIADIKGKDRQKLSDISPSVGQNRFPLVPAAEEGNLFEATLDRTTMIPAESRLCPQDKSYEELMGKGKQVNKDKQLYQRSQRDDQISATEIHAFASLEADTAYVPSFFPNKTPSLKKNDFTKETKNTMPQKLGAGTKLFQQTRKPVEDFNTYSDVSAGSRILKKNNNSDKLEREKLQVTEASYSGQEFAKTNDIRPIFNRHDDKARGSKSEHSKQASVSDPVTAWIVKAIDSDDRISVQVADNITDDSYEVKRRIKNTPDNGHVNIVQKTRTPKNVESQPRSSQGLIKNSRVIIVEPEEIRRKRRKTKNERAVDFVLNKKGTVLSDHISVTESDNVLDHVKSIKTHRSDVSQQKSLNASNITVMDKDGFTKEFHSKTIEQCNPDIEIEKTYTDTSKSLRKLNDVISLKHESSKKFDRVDLGCLKTKVDLFQGRGDEIKLQSDKGLCKRCKKELIPALDSPRLMTSALTSDVRGEYDMKERIELHKERPVPSDVYYELINIVENLTLTYGAEALTRNKSIEQLLNAIYNRTELTGHGVRGLAYENGLAFSSYNGAMKGKETEKVDGINVNSRIVLNVLPKYPDNDTEIPNHHDKSDFSNVKPEHDTQEETVDKNKPRKSKIRRIIKFFEKWICCKNVDESDD